jgi:putative ABC transport system permease protein
MFIGEQITLGSFVPHGRTSNDFRPSSPAPSLRPVSPGYLTAMGARWLGGRDLPETRAAGSPAAIVISRTAARRLFETASPVGQLVDWQMDNQPAILLEVAGVIEDLRNTSPDREPYPEVFIDYRHLLKLQEQWGEPAPRQDQTALGLLSFAIRTSGDPVSAIAVVVQIVRSVTPAAGIDAILPMDRLVAGSVARQRFYAITLGLFAGIAGILAAIGIYGVLAYAVTRRTQEIGIRMALGARRGQVLSAVLRQGLGLTATGITLGLAAAAAGTRMIQGLLFGITPLDPGTFGVVVVMFGLVAALASYIPARRATHVDPMVALRSE